MSVAVEIARTLPCFAVADEVRVRNVVAGWSATGWPLSSGENIVIRWARMTEELLAGCDAETVDAVLEALDRVRAGMVR